MHHKSPSSNSIDRRMGGTAKTFQETRGGSSDKDVAARLQRQHGATDVECYNCNRIALCKDNFMCSSIRHCDDDGAIVRTSNRDRTSAGGTYVRSKVPARSQKRPQEIATAPMCL